MRINEIGSPWRGLLALSAAAGLLACQSPSPTDFYAPALTPDAGRDSMPPQPGPAAYTPTEQTLASGRSYLQVVPTVSSEDSLPLVIAFHGYQDPVASVDTLRSALPLEAQAAAAAVFAYPHPETEGGEWQFGDDAGRTKETAFVRALIDAVATDVTIDRGRIFLVGWDAGAVLANTLACRLGKRVLRGVAIDSGTLYPVTKADGTTDFMQDDITAATSCDLPNAMLIWGTADTSPGLDYGRFNLTRAAYSATLGCGLPGALWADTTCLTYPGCRQELVGCSVDGLDHRLWPNAAGAIWSFFSGLE